MLKEILKAEYVEILQGCLGREWNRRDAPRNSIREVGTGAVGLGFVPPNLPRIASVSQRKKKDFPLSCLSRVGSSNFGVTGATTLEREPLRNQGGLDY